AELPEGPVTAVAVAGHPELEPVALAPVGVGLVRGVDLPRGRLADVALGDQLGVAPTATLQVQETQLGDVLGAREQAAESLFPAGWPGQPADLPYAERVEQPRPQVAAQRGAGGALDDGPQRVGARLAVREDGAGLFVRRDHQKTSHRLLRDVRQ